MPEYQNYLFPPSPSTTAKEVSMIETSQEQIDKILLNVETAKIADENQQSKTGGRRKKRTIKKYKKYKKIKQ
jgi:hypothetical protein